MKKLNLKKIITMGLITTSILAVTSIGASAEWKQNNTGWYNTKSNNTYSVGWEKIGSSWYYFDNSGYMQQGWIKSGNDWYYLNSDGSMVTGTFLTDGQISSFTSGGIWQGYITNSNSNSTSNTTNTNNNSTNASNSATQTTTASTDNSFTLAKAVEYAKAFGNMSSDYVTFKTKTFEDKIYVSNGKGVESGITYRLLAKINVLDGSYDGLLMVSNTGITMDWMAGSYTENVDSTFNEDALDPTGKFVYADYYASWNNNTAISDPNKADEEEMDRMSNLEYRKGHMDEYNRLVAKYNSK